MRVYVPFAQSDLAQCKQKLGQFQGIQTNLQIDEFQALALTFNLTWSDLHVVLSTYCTPEEKKGNLCEAQAYADSLTTQDFNQPLGDIPISRENPNWNINQDTPALLGVTT